MILAALIAAAAQAAAPAAPTELGAIRMHLFYESSGRLSDDISPPRSFTAWNIVIGEGDAEEPANDLLIVTELRSAGQQNVRTPLRVAARDSRGRLLGERRFTNMLTSQAGRAYLPLWLRDVGCAGIVTVTATLGQRSISETLSLNCGE